MMRSYFYDEGGRPSFMRGDEVAIEGNFND